MEILTEYNFFVVHYYGDSAQNIYIVPKFWLIDIKNNFPYNSLVYFDTEVASDITQSYIILVSDFNNGHKREGRSYRGQILGGFGKDLKL